MVWGIFSNEPVDFLGHFIVIFLAFGCWFYFEIVRYCPKVPENKFETPNARVEPKG